jgi:omega-amidase
MKIGCAQIDCISGDAEANLRKMREYTYQAREAGCDMVVFPEMVDTGCETETLGKYASSWSEGPFLQLQSIAEETRLCIVCGISEVVEDKLYNAVAILGHDGQLLAHYRKTHLITTEPFEEQRVFTAGDSFCMFSFGGLKFGVMVCYDLRFPEVARYYATHEASVILMPSAWPLSRLTHWKTLIAARAIENQLYMACSNRVGKDGELEFGGNSRIVDPWGEMVAHGSELEERLIVGSVDMQRLQEIRNFMPVLKHRRTDLYGTDI